MHTCVIEVLVCMSMLTAVVVTVNRSAMLVRMRGGRVRARAEAVDEWYAHPSLGWVKMYKIDQIRCG